MATPRKNEPRLTPEKTASQNSTPLSQRLKRERLATERATLLLGCYRRSDATDPDVYIRAIACVLAGYDEWVIVEATHPRTGIQATPNFKSWPPNSGEVKAFCNDMAKQAARYAIYDKLPKPDVPPLIFDDAQPPPRPALPRERRPSLVELAERHPDMTWAQNILRSAATPLSTPEARLQACNDRLAATGLRLTQEEFDAIPDAVLPGWKKSA